MISSKSGSMGAANATVGPVSMINANVSAVVSGVFVGTIALQCCPTGAAANWVTVGTPLTAPGVISVQGLAGDLQFQLVCTAYTSGSASAYLAACPTS
jgi:hypothetical protein